jgi:hypothetical protein
MKEGHKRTDVVLEELINEAIVELETFFVHRAVRPADDTGPGNGKPVGLQFYFFHEGDILLIAMVVIAGDPAGRTIRYLSRHIAKIIPDGRHFPVLVPGPLDLVGCGGRAPEKLFGKFVHR